MPLHNPQRRKSELTRMNVNIKFSPVSSVKRLFFLVSVVMMLIEVGILPGPKNVMGAALFHCVRLRAERSV
jgi:hypothetical protein